MPVTLEVIWAAAIRIPAWITQIIIMQPKPPLCHQQHKQPLHCVHTLPSETSGSADWPLTGLQTWYDSLNHKNTTNSPSDFTTCNLLHVFKKKIIILSKSPLGGFEKLWFNRHFRIFRKGKYLCSISPNPTWKRGTKPAATTLWFPAILYNCSLQKNSYHLVSKNWYEKSDFCSSWSQWKFYCSIQ